MIHHSIPPIKRSSKYFAMILGATLILSACSPKQANESGRTAQPPVPQDQVTTDNQPPDASIPVTPTAESAVTVETPAESNLSACDLVTPEEASAAVGNTVGDPVEEDYPPLYGCRYEASSLEFVSISLAVFYDAEQAAGAFQSEADLNPYEEVSGIGDRALRTDILDIDVLKGKYMLGIGVVNSGDDEARYEQAKKLALLALDRLP